jgi:hypothetical protein
LNITSDFDGLWPIRCFDSGGQGIPACSVVAITGSGQDADGRPYITVAQATSSTLTNQVAIISRWAVAKGGYGRCAVRGVVPVAYDTGTPQTQDAWGMKAGQWTATLSDSGVLLVLGVLDSSNRIMWVQFPNAAGGGGTPFGLYDNLNIGGNAAAYPLNNPAGGNWSINSSGNTFTITDQFSQWLGVGFSGGGNSNNASTGFYQTIGNSNIPVSMHQKARFIAATTSAFISKSTSSISNSQYTGLVSDDGGLLPQTQPSIVNPGFCLDSGQPFVAYWRNSITSYQVFDGNCSQSTNC